MKVFFTLIFISVFNLFCFSQNVIPKGKTEIKEFSNSTAKFIVPDGKTWYISNVFSSIESVDQETNYIILKKINNTTFGENGPVLSNFARSFISYPIILPEKTSFEILISDASAKAILIYTEVDN